MKLIAQISAEFGLTPAARTRVQVEISTEPDEFEMFLANGRKLGR
jgi:phage terminase small subunit